MAISFNRLNHPLPAAMALFCGLLACGNAPAAEGSWKFEPSPDTYSPDSLLDLRSLNEKFAGEHGFIRLSADGRDFVMGNGQPIRFWAMHSDIFGKTPEAMADQARFLAKRGVNL